MVITTILIGLLPITYGLYILFLRVRDKTESLRKIESMKERFGEKLGSTIHFLAYVIMPIIFGSFIVLSGFLGISILEIFSN